MKPRILSLSTRFLILPIGALLFAHYANADTLYWDRTGGGAINDGAGAWLGTGLWNNGSPSANWTSGDNAIFGNSGAGAAVTLASPGTSVGSMTFNYFTGTYTLGTVSSEITLNNGITKNAGAGIVTFQGASNIKLGAAQSLTNNSATNLTIGALSLNSNVLTIGGTGTTTFDGNAANVLSGAGGIIKNGSGNFNFDGSTSITHTFTGNITVNGGSIGFQNSSVLTGRNVNLTNGYLGGRFNSGFTWTAGLGTGNDQIQITGGTSGLSGEGGNGSTFTIGSSGSTLKWGAAGENGATGFFNPTVFLANGDARMNTNGKGTLANGLDLNGTTRTITSLQTTDGGATSGFTISSAIVNTAGSAAGLTKTGVGNLILTEANTYDGATTISSAAFNTVANGGGAITLSGSGTINNTSALNLNGTGTLRLVNTAQVDRFADVAVTSTGGTISYENSSGAVNYTETLGGSGSAVTLSSGNLDVVLNTNQASTGSQTLTFGTGGTTNMVQSGTATVTFSAATTGPQATGNKNMIVVIGSGTTSGWVNAAASNPIIGPWATTGTAAAAQTDYAVYSDDYVVPANTAASAESNWTSATAQYTAGLLGTGSTTLGSTRNIAALKLNATTSALTSVTFAGAAAADFITVTGSSFANGDIVSFGGTAPGGLSTGVPYYVVNSGTNGAGTFTVSATSGGSPIDLTSAGTSPNVVAGITLGSGINLGTTGILNATGAGVTIGKGTGGVVTLPSTTSGNLYMNASNAAAIIVGAPIADNGVGVLTLVKSGASTLRLFDVSTYTGNTAINAGTLQIGLNGTANGAKLGGSGGNYAGNIFIAAGASLNHQSDAAQTLSGIISGDGVLTKNNTGVLTLSGNNTYTGKTTIAGLTASAGATLSVASFNSVVGGTANSSLGAPTTVANGIIELGGGAQTTDTLRYTGSGETTDRVINFNFSATSTKVLETNNGSGLLRFTSSFTSNGTATSSVTLQGSGSGQLDGGLPFAFTTLTKTGASTWTIAGPVGATGGVTLNGGSTGSRLNINHSQALGTGTFTISSGNNATIGNTSGADITVTTNNAQSWTNNFAVVATNSLHMGTGNVTLGGTRQITVTGAGTFTVGGVISGSALGITKLGVGTMVLSGANAYSGATTVTTGTLATTSATQGFGTNLSGISIGGSGTLSLRNDSSVSFTNGTSAYNIANSASGSTINIDRVTGTGSNTITVGNLTTTSTAGSWGLNFTGANGVSLNAGALSTPVSTVAATHTITNNITGGGTLTLASVFNQATTIASPALVFTGAGNTTVTGAITQTLANMVLTKNGAGTLTLGGTSTYTGATTVSAGTLALGANDVLPNASAVSIGTATLNAATFTDSVGTLDVISMAAVINLGSGGALAFANSSAVSWTDVVGNLNITGTYTPTSIRFGTTSGGLTPAQLAVISVNGSGAGTYTLDTDGYLVSGGPDTTPPTLTSITDNVSGGPIDIDSPVTYTVTFNEDMDASTVSAADFSNAGTATVSIGAITEITPGVSTVLVTPTTSGTLRLQIPNTAVLNDVAGNPLDNDPALLDDTTITVRTLFDSWANSNGATGGKAVDPDGDGYNNLMEFAFDTNPATNSAASLAYSGGVVTAHGQPILVQESGTYYAVFGRRVNYVAAGLVYTVQFSAGLDQWISSVTVPTTVATDGVIDAVQIPFPNLVSTPSGPKKPTFFRLVISEL